jgi:glycerol uptake facilitator-like aquaporin
MCLYRKFPWKKWLPYACAQVLGCFCGAAVIYGNYKSAIDEYEGGAGIRTVPGYSDTATAGVFNTYPQAFLSKTGQVFSEIVASTVLIFVIFALKDDNNLGAGNLTPLMLFLLIFGKSQGLLQYAANRPQESAPPSAGRPATRSTWPVTSGHASSLTWSATVRRSGRQATTISGCL